METHRHSIFCILPPHVVKKIAENGTAKQKARAVETLKTTAQLKAVRHSMAELRIAAKATGPNKNRIVYDAKTTENLPGTKVRGEGDPPVADVAVNEAYDGAGHTYDLYYEIFERNSLDDKGMDLISSVHYGQGYDNAFWNGQQMVYGDGDEDLPENQRLFNRFTIALDVIGHELTHGVTSYEADLAYWDQSGALNESYSDVFGSLVKQRVLGQTADQADWLIGEGLLTANVNGKAIRSMKAPGTAYDDPVLGKDPQPDHMSKYVQTTQDNGGVHINSGIPNRAFYGVAMAIGGNAWEKAGKIWYITLRDKLDERSDFQQAADLTFLVAGELYGIGSTEQNAVRQGWGEVGIAVGATSGGGGGSSPGPSNGANKPGCLGGLLGGK